MSELERTMRSAVRVGRGFFGIGIVNGKTEKNIGSLWRAASMYDAAFIFTVGRRYERQASDTPNTPLHTPLFEYEDIDQLMRHLPYGAPLIGVEMHEESVSLRDFKHPLRGIYLLGAEDHGIPLAVLDRCHMLVQIPSPKPVSMNVAVAGTMVMHHRWEQAEWWAA